MKSDMDRLGGNDGAFTFFRRKSSEICLAFGRQRSRPPSVIMDFYQTIAESRLRRAFGALLDIADFEAG
jgi:hypothetical protein